MMGSARASSGRLRASPPWTAVVNGRVFRSGGTAPFYSGGSLAEGRSRGRAIVGPRTGDRRRRRERDPASLRTNAHNALRVDATAEKRSKNALDPPRKRW